MPYPKGDMAMMKKKPSMSEMMGVEKKGMPMPPMKKAGKAPKKMMKSGGTVSMQLGSYKGVIGKNTKGKATKAVGLTKAKYGKSMGKCKNGC